MILFNDVCSIINTVFYLTKKYHLMILFLIVIGCIVFCSHLLYIWYRVPHKSVTFTTNVVGCIGNPKCKIIALMNYGNEKQRMIPLDSLCRYIIRSENILHICSRGICQEHHLIYQEESDITMNMNLCAINMLPLLIPFQQSIKAK